MSTGDMYSYMRWRFPDDQVSLSVCEDVVDEDESWLQHHFLYMDELVGNVQVFIVA